VRHVTLGHGVDGGGRLRTAWNCEGRLRTAGRGAVGAAGEGMSDVSCCGNHPFGGV